MLSPTAPDPLLIGISGLCLYEHFFFIQDCKNRYISSLRDFSKWPGIHSLDLGSSWELPADQGVCNIPESPNGVTLLILPYHFSYIPHCSWASGVFYFLISLRVLIFSFQSCRLISQLKLGFPGFPTVPCCLVAPSGEPNFNLIHRLPLFLPFLYQTCYPLTTSPLCSLFYSTCKSFSFGDFANISGLPRQLGPCDCARRKHPGKLPLSPTPWPPLFPSILHTSFLIL